MMESLFFNVLTVALSTMILPALLLRPKPARRSSTITAVVLLVNAILTALLWITLRSHFIHGEQWSYSGPLYIHWGIVIGSVAAWHFFGRRTIRPGGDQPLE